MLFQTDHAAEAGPVPSGFNWGAFLFTPLFLLWYGRIGTALFLVGASLISSLDRGGCLILLTMLVSLVVAVYFGFNANEVAWSTQRFETYTELRKSMLGWNIAGVVLVALFVIRALLA